LQRASCQAPCNQVTLKARDALIQATNQDNGSLVLMQWK